MLKLLILFLLPSCAFLSPEAKAERLYRSRTPADWEKALVLYKKLGEDAYLEKIYNLHRRLVNYYMSEKMWNKALQHNKEALNIKPEDPLAWTDMGIIRANLGDYAGALQAYEKAIALDPSNPLPYYGAGLLYFYKLNDKNKGVEFLRKSVAVDSLFLRGYLALARVSYELEDYAVCLDYYRQALKLMPTKGHKTAQVYYNMGLVYRTIGMEKKAKECFRQALKADSTFSPAKEALK